MTDQVKIFCFGPMIALEFLIFFKLPNISTFNVHFEYIKDMMMLEEMIVSFSIC